jgi:hypothetical protein
VVLLYGGGLGEVRKVSISRLPDRDPGKPFDHESNSGEGGPVEQPTIQPSENSVKFVLPSSLSAGVFAVGFGGAPVILDAPQVDWCQPTTLEPGLNENEARAGSMIQIFGRNFSLKNATTPQAKVMIKALGPGMVPLSVQARDKYSIVATLPSELPPGEYQLFVHNGYGGPAGWSRPATIRIVAGTAWPSTVFSVTDFGAKGDNLTDDSDALRSAFAAAEANGGGIVKIPAGSYLVKGWFRIPRRVVLRGAGKDDSWLKWPQSNPASEADLIPATLFTNGEFGIENLSLQVRNAQVVLRDLSWDALMTANATPPLPELAGAMTPLGEERDIFLRNVRFDYRYYMFRPTVEPAADPRWIHDRFGWGSFGWHGKLVMILALGGARNVEVSHCDFTGGTQRFMDCRNARLVDNKFNNQLATLSFTDMGGEYIVFQHNEINGASSWRPNFLPLRYIYCADNRSSNVVTGEREALTFDINWIVAGVLGRQKASAWDPVTTPVLAWEGKVISSSGSTVRLEGAQFQPRIYTGFDIQVLSGTGAGQFREVSGSQGNEIEVTRPWDVPLDQTSVVLIHHMLRNVILFRNHAEDTSVFFQIWGHLYDGIIDSNEVEHSSGMWGTAGWFVQWIDNRILTYLEQMGPFGTIGERGQEYGVLGFTIEGKLLQLPIPFQYVRGCVMRGNHLTHHERILIMTGYGGPRRRAPIITAQDVVIEHNEIDDSPIGIELDPNVGGAVIAGNKFNGVEEPLRLGAPENVVVIQ